LPPAADAVNIHATFMADFQKSGSANFTEWTATPEPPEETTSRGRYLQCQERPFMSGQAESDTMELALVIARSGAAGVSRDGLRKVVRLCSIPTKL
jgi:hypothetical protein